MEENHIKIEEHGVESETHEEQSHGHPIYAESILSHGGFVTNSLLISWIAVLIIVAIAFSVKRKTKMVPKGIDRKSVV